mmetsp:Transcript_3745/g.13106  ORF Transcript_3745/g.13106 Transcript_3745/m.13106 type:complete len:330 (+) Transcript_3745:124-1113(+)
MRPIEAMRRKLLGCGGEGNGSGPSKSTSSLGRKRWALHICTGTSAATSSYRSDAHRRAWSSSMSNLISLTSAGRFVLGSATSSSAVLVSHAASQNTGHDTPLPASFALAKSTCSSGLCRIAGTDGTLVFPKRTASAERPASCSCSAASWATASAGPRLSITTPARSGSTATAPRSRRAARDEVALWPPTDALDSAAVGACTPTHGTCATHDSTPLHSSMFAPSKSCTSSAAVVVPAHGEFKDCDAGFRPSSRPPGCSSRSTSPALSGRSGSRQMGSDDSTLKTDCAHLALGCSSSRASPSAAPNCRSVMAGTMTVSRSPLDSAHVLTRL